MAFSNRQRRHTKRPLAWISRGTLSMRSKLKIQATTLGKLLSAKGLSLADVAAKMEYNPSYLYRLCAGLRKPSARERALLPEFLGVAEEDLFSDQGAIYNPLALVSEEVIRQALQKIRDDDTALWLFAQAFSRVGELLSERQESTR